MAASWVRQNPILKVRFAGWQSDTYTLGRCGWDVGIIERPHDPIGSADIVLRNRQMRLAGIGTFHDYGRFKYESISRNGFVDGLVMPEIEITAIKDEGNLIITGRRESYTDIRWVDTCPTASHIDLQQFSFRDIPLFVEKDKPLAQELIINPEDVQQVLDLVLKAQAPGMKDIRERDRRRERDQGITRHVHAQIISFPQAA